MVFISLWCSWELESSLSEANLYVEITVFPDMDFIS